MRKRCREALLCAPECSKGFEATAILAEIRVAYTGRRAELESLICGVHFENDIVHEPQDGGAHFKIERGARFRDQTPAGQF